MTDEQMFLVQHRVELGAEIGIVGERTTKEFSDQRRDRLPPLPLISCHELVPSTLRSRFVYDTVERCVFEREGDLHECQLIVSLPGGVTFRILVGFRHGPNPENDIVELAKLEEFLAAILPCVEVRAIVLEGGDVV